MCQQYLQHLKLPSHHPSIIPQSIPGIILLLSSPPLVYKISSTNPPHRQSITMKSHGTQINNEDKKRVNE